MEASIEGKLNVVKYLVDQKADLHAVSNTEVNSVWLAAAEGRTDVIKYLLSKGANPVQTRNDGISALSAACVAGHVDTVKLLLKDKQVKDRDLVNVGDQEVRSDEERRQRA